MKKLLRILAIALIVAVLAMPAALADMRRGDRGEDVRHLQSLLFDLGWLFENPDGVFGRNTENAVKKYQSYVGLQPDGVATDDLVEQLEVDWSIAYGGDSNGADDAYIVPGQCRVLFGHGEICLETCEEHRAVLEKIAKLRVSSTLNRTLKACQLWEDEVERMYRELMDSSPAEEKLTMLAAYGAWVAYYERAQDAATACWPYNPGAAANYRLAIVTAQAAMLCAVGAGEPYVPLQVYYDGGDAAAYGPEHCTRENMEPGIDYISCCDEHAPLAERAFGLIDDGAEAEFYAMRGEWEQALDEQFWAWNQACPDQAEAVLLTRDSFFALLDAQDAMLSGNGPDSAAGWRLQSVMLEALRLCELLGA